MENGVGGELMELNSVHEQEPPKGTHGQEERDPDMWRLSAGGISIPPVPHNQARSAAIQQHYYDELTPEQRANLIWDPDNDVHWTNFFR
jgi:hypothetical protein